MAGLFGRFLLGLAFVLAITPARAQYSVTTPVTCRPDGSFCVGATPVVNPDGTFVGSGGSGATPTGTAGTPNPAVVSVQGVASGTPQNTTVATALPAGTNNIGGVVGRGSGTLATGQISVATTSTLVVAARTGRAKVTFAVGAANTCAFGNTGVTTTTGFPLQPVAGASLTIDTSAAVYAACSATTTVSFIEQY